MYTHTLDRNVVLSVVGAFAGSSATLVIEDSVDHPDVWCFRALVQDDKTCVSIFFQSLGDDLRRGETYKMFSDKRKWFICYPIDDSSSRIVPTKRCG